MATIHLKPETVSAYMGKENKFNGCREIQSIICREETPSRWTIEARVPTLSTNFTPYTICITVEKDGSAIHKTTCNCPVGWKCKHVNKVLQRMIDSSKNPIAERPNYKRKVIETKAKVYIAYAYKYYEYPGRGREYSCERHLIDESEGYETLGMFFSKRAANRCAKERAYPDDEEEEEDDDDNDSVNTQLFYFNSQDDGPEEYKYYECGEFAFEKVWVECRTINDPSPEFHM